MTNFDEDDPVIGYADLGKLGVTYSRHHLARLWKQGRFVVPFKLTSNRLSWRKSEVLDWIEERRRLTEQHHKYK